MQRGPPAEDGHSHPSEEQRGGARAARMERGGDGPSGQAGRGGTWRKQACWQVWVPSHLLHLCGACRRRAGEASGLGTGAWAANSRGSQHTGGDG